MISIELRWLEVKSQDLSSVNPVVTSQDGRSFVLQIRYREGGIGRERWRDWENITPAWTV